MASINYAAREISVKIVYYGPGLSGKTTNLQVIHRKVPPEYKSDMVSLATETDRTLFFDFLPLDLGKIKGFSTKFQLYTVPGQVYYNATRKLVLRGVDGVVFVADSSPDKVQENLESFQNLEENLSEYGYKRESVPIIIQYNKRDLPNALTIEELQQLVNKYNLPWSEAIANKGKGVFDSLKLIGKIVIDYLNKKYSRGPRTPDQNTPPPVEVKRPFTQDSSSQQQNQFPAGQQQSNNFGSYQMPMQGSAPAYQQPYQPPQMRNVAPQPRPAMPQQRTPQQPPMNTMAPPQARMVPPQIVPVPKPTQQPQFGINNGMPQQSGNIQQNASYFPPQQTMRPQQPQNFNRGTPPQQNFVPNNNQNNFVPPQPMPPIQKQSPFQPQNQFEVDSFDDSQTFEPQAQVPVSGFGDNRQANQQNDFFDYGSINLEPMGNTSAQQIPNEEVEMLLEPVQQAQGFMPPQESGNVNYAQNQFDGSGKTDLDLEIEKYQREIEEKQKKIRIQPGTQAQQQNPSPKAMPFQGQSAMNTGVQQQQQKQPTQQGGPFSGNSAENDYDVYNMELPSFPPQSQPPTQRQPAVGADDGDDAMFFTSVDPDRQKRPLKKPVVNPRTAKDQPQQQKGFLSKFFNRDTP
jgi:signal recognition particle receptor subunit beta